MGHLLEDLRSSIRAFRRRPVVTLVSVSILVVGLASTVAVFNYANTFSHTLPGIDHEGLVRLFGVEEDNPYLDFSLPDFVDYAAGVNDSFEDIAAVATYYAASVRREDLTEVGLLEATSGSYFSVLEIKINLGRGIEPADDQPSAAPVAVLSHRWWQRGFNGDPSVLGKTVFLNFQPFTIVGVAAPDFVGVASDFRPDLWIPIAPFRVRYWGNRADDRNLPLVRVYGRLKNRANLTQARAELTSVAAGLDAMYPSRDEPRQLRLEPATWIDPRARLDEQTTVRLMMGASAGLLLLVCANVANLLLAVSNSRRREIALRAAIGASPGRLASQVLAENVVLSTFAGLVALVLANPTATWLGSYFARPSVWGFNFSRETSTDWRVVVFALAVSIFTGLIAGILPALNASRLGLVHILKTDTLVAAGGPRFLLGRRLPSAATMLVSMQVALAVVLVVTAGLVARTLSTVLDRDPGFSYEQMVAAQISTSSTDVTPEDRERFLRDMARALANEPWVRTATAAGYATLSSHRSLSVRFEGQDENTPLPFTTVMPGYFDELGIDVLQGRSVATRDSMGSSPVVVVNDAFVRRYYSESNPLGRRIWLDMGDGTERELEIVGVVGDVMENNFLTEPEPFLYVPYGQRASGTSNALMIQPTVDPNAAVAMTHRWLREYEPYLAIVNVLPYRDVVSGFVYVQRMNAQLFSLLAVLGLTLAAVGVFGVMTLTVTQRTREVGIRMALGARGRDIGDLMLRHAMTPVLLGLVVGLVISFGLAGLTKSLLFGVEHGDPVSVIGGGAVIVVSALTAAYLPSRRAATLDPVDALRTQA